MISSIQSTGPLPTGVLLVGHGTRSEVGRAQCEALAADVASRLNPRIYLPELAYLELASPTIEDGIRRLKERQIDRLIVVPLLLFAAGHAKDDIPAAVRVALAAAGIPSLPTLQSEPFGTQKPVLELAAQRYCEAAESLIPATETCLLLIGRGSRDEAATAEMRKLGSLLQQRLGIGRLEVGFLAMAQPTSQSVIQAASQSSYHQIVVQPHLLFHGDLMERLKHEVSVAAANSPDKTWRTSRVLGGETQSLSCVLQQLIRNCQPTVGHRNARTSVEPSFTAHGILVSQGKR